MTRNVTQMMADAVKTIKETEPTPSIHTNAMESDVSRYLGTSALNVIPASKKVSSELKETVELNEGVSKRHPIEGHPYHSKSSDQLHFIIKDAGEAAKAMKDHNPQAESKYLDQQNDAATVLGYRKRAAHPKTGNLPTWYMDKYFPRAGVKESVDDEDGAVFNAHQSDAEKALAAKRKQGQDALDKKKAVTRIVKRSQQKDVSDDDENEPEVHAKSMRPGEGLKTSAPSWMNTTPAAAAKVNTAKAVRQGLNTSSNIKVSSAYKSASEIDALPLSPARKAALKARHGFTESVEEIEEMAMAKSGKVSWINHAGLGHVIYHGDTPTHQGYLDHKSAAAEYKKQVAKASGLSESIITKKGLSYTYQAVVDGKILAEGVTITKAAAETAIKNIVDQYDSKHEVSIDDVLGYAKQFANR